MDRKKVSSKNKRSRRRRMRKLLFGATQQTGLRRGECEKPRATLTGQDSEAGKSKNEGDEDNWRPLR